MGKFDDEVMHKVWEYEQDILDVVHKVCKENHLRYTLYFGTLLGAVRHGGFIPWDDDIDIVMPREDYNKLIRIWSQVAPEGYIFQDYRTNPDSFNNFVKIRKDHTTFLQFDVERDRSYHKGIFVDIFPADRLAPGKIKPKIQLFAYAVNLLYTREYTSGSKGIIGFVEKTLLKLPKRFHIPLKYAAEKYAAKWNGRVKTAYVCSGTISDCKLRLPSDMFDNLKLIDFNGKRYFAVNDTDQSLKICYGDYMKLPPVEKQKWFHHPILIDFKRNYEEIN